VTFAASEHCCLANSRRRRRKLAPDALAAPLGKPSSSCRSEHRLDWARLSPSRQVT
jgi:hypothetical protein